MRKKFNPFTGLLDYVCDSLNDLTTKDHDLLDGLLDDDHTQYLLADGSRELTADWDAGSHKIIAEQFESDVLTGTPPFIVASTTLVTNLNSDLLDGYHVGTSGSTIPVLDGINIWSGLNTFNAGIFLPDNAKAEFGDTSGSADLEIYSDGTNPWIMWDLGHRVGFKLDETQVAASYCPIIYGRGRTGPGETDVTVVFHKFLRVRAFDAGTDSHVYLDNAITSGLGGFALHPSFTPEAVEFYTENADMIIQAAGSYKTVVNFDKGDTDFLIHGDTLDNIFFVDASADRIGIGTNAPSALFDVNGISKANSFTSDIAPGTQPYACRSTTLNANLNADMLDGYHIGTSGATVPLLSTANTWGAAQTFSATVRFDGELLGSRMLLPFGITSIAADGYLKTTGTCVPSATEGLCMPRAGSIVGISVCFEWVETTPGSIQFQVRVNNLSVFFTTVAIHGSGIYTSYAIQVRGTDTFSAGDLIQAYVDYLPGLPPVVGTCNDVMLLVEVQYDT